MEKPVDKPWDDSLRRLVRANPQAFVTWLLGEAQFIKELPDKLKSWKIELGEISPEELLRMDQPGLFPLLPLTKGGARREVVDTMFTGLQTSGQTELMTIGIVNIQ